MDPKITPGKKKSINTIREQRSHTSHLSANHLWVHEHVDLSKSGILHERGVFLQVKQQ